MHYATLTAQTELVELLAMWGADLEVPDNKGRTALYIAAESGYQEIVEVLLSFSAAVD